MRYFETLSLVLATGFFFPHLPSKSIQTPSLPIRQYVSAMRTKNIDDVLHLYAANAVFVDPNGNKFATPDDLRKLYEQTFATYDSDLLFTRTSLKVKGDIDKAGAHAVETDAYRENLLVRKTKQMQLVCGESTSSWVKQDDGQWLMNSQTWTSKPCSITPEV
jgi:ketosteroid isomerase-like protein